MVGLETRNDPSIRGNNGFGRSSGGLDEFVHGPPESIYSAVGRAGNVIVFVLGFRVKKGQGGRGRGRGTRKCSVGSTRPCVRRSPWQNVAGNIRESHLHRCSLPEEGYPVTSTSITAKFNGKVFGLATSRY